MEPKLSIIITAMNFVEFTEQCIKALALSVDVPFEVLVMDNGSTDRTKEYIEYDANR